MAVSRSDQPPEAGRTQDRRRFLRNAGTAAAATLAAGSAGFGSTFGDILQTPPTLNPDSPKVDGERATKSFEIRRDAALRNGNLPLPTNADNGDEKKYPDKIGSYTKGLPHNSEGIVESSAYQALLNATLSGLPSDFDLIPMGGTVRLVNPQAGLTFDLEGMDSHLSTMGPAPEFASAERAAEAVECYWMALLRDLGFAQYAANETALAACAELSKMSDFRGPKKDGSVTPETLFRGFTKGDAVGPYISQFLLHTLNYGAIPLRQSIKTYLSLSDRGSDYMTDLESWLAAQNGQGPFAMNSIDPLPRHIRNGRDLSAYVHADQAYQAFFNATLFFAHDKLPVNPGSPYKASKTQSAFATFGLPHIQAMLGVVSGCALRAVWYQKWFVHRTLRPEEFGGRLHFVLADSAKYPIHPDALNAKAVAQVQAANGTYLLPQAFPEGCPQHPSYAQGHAAVSGACATLLKALLDERRRINDFADVVEASNDGLSLATYQGTDASQLTIGGELNKLASNIAMGRNYAGIHWRSDYVEGLRIGEAAAIAVLEDQRRTFTENFKGLSFTKFDGTLVTV